MRFETHIHTVIGSYDGAITVEDLKQWVEENAVGGICLTDHDYVWPLRGVEKLQSQLGCVVVQGVEVTTDAGHVLAFGLPEYVPGIHQIETLRREIDNVGGLLILAHPFRHELSTHYQYGGRPAGLPPWEEVLTRPVFGYVDALEACNGSGVWAEEAAVRQVADELGLPVTGGSDAHRAGRLGLCITEFTADITSQQDFIDAVKAGLSTALDLRRHVNGGE